MFKNRKKIFFLSFILILSLLFVGCNEKKEEITVTISIEDPKETGIILDSTTVKVEEGDTVIDLLKAVTKEYKIHLDYTGSKSSTYVKGINNIYEFDKGSESGWIYRVNNEIINTSAGSYKLKDGDKVEWLYTTELGKEFEE